MAEALDRPDQRRRRGHDTDVRRARIPADKGVGAGVGPGPLGSPSESRSDHLDDGTRVRPALVDDGDVRAPQSFSYPDGVGLGARDDHGWQRGLGPKAPADLVK